MIPIDNLGVDFQTVLQPDPKSVPFLNFPLPGVSMFRGFGFVQFEHVEEAEAAKAEVNKQKKQLKECQAKLGLDVGDNVVFVVDISPNNLSKRS